jgi:fructokinase
MSKIVIAVGDLLWDLLESGPELGGAPSNFAYRINSLGHRGLIASRVGLDPLGSKAIDLLKARRMETTYIQRDLQFPTGTVQVKLNDNREPDFHIVPNVAYDELQAPKELLDLASTADCICFGTLIQRTSRARAALYQILDFAPRAIKVLDLNLRNDCYSTETIQTSLEKATLLKLNHHEADYLAQLFELPTDLPAFSQAVMQRWNLTHCLVTKGDNGLYVRGPQGAEVSLRGIKVEVVDTCGAGDACTAGFIHSILNGESLSHSAVFANSLGALAATTHGGTSPIALEDVIQLAASS